MSDREAELRALAARFREHQGVNDAFLAKSFTDYHLVVDVRHGESIPESIHERLTEHDLYGANEVYGSDDGDLSFAGDVSHSTRHHFVDVRSRGEYQSYVVD